MYMYVGFPGQSNAVHATGTASHLPHPFNSQPWCSDMDFELLAPDAPEATDAAASPAEAPGAPAPAAAGGEPVALASGRRMMRIIGPRQRQRGPVRLPPPLHLAVRAQLRLLGHLL